MMTAISPRLISVIDVCVRCACRRGLRTKVPGKPKRPTRTSNITKNDPSPQMDASAMPKTEFKSLKSLGADSALAKNSRTSKDVLLEGSTKGGNKRDHMMKETGGRFIGQAKNVFSKSSVGGIGLKTLIKPFLFTIGFSGCSFVGSTIWQYESMRRYGKNFSKTPDPFSQWKIKISQHKSGDLQNKLKELWNSLSAVEKTVLGIISLNTAVFFLWKVPALQGTMMKWFTCNPAVKGPVCLPLLLSTFSHYSAVHLGINMYVLWTFAPAVGSILGKEQFTAFYLSSGVISSFCSSLYKVSISRFYPSLGASGAILAVLGAVCTQIPDTRLSIVFFPFFTFSAGVALKGIIAMESLGLMLRWKIFDHAAHLGGLLFGSWYVKYGHQMTWAKREAILMKWHKLREQRKR